MNSSGTTGREASLASRGFSTHGSLSGASKPWIVLDSVELSRGGRPVLTSLSAELRGRAIGLVGANGAGKSTLIGAMLGVLRPASGSISVLGHAPGREVRTRGGVMAEQAGVFPGGSGVDAVAFAGQLTGLSRREALRRAHRALDALGVGEERYRPTTGYSTGMRQRCKLAMSFVHEPEFLVLDEPTVGLDPVGRLQLLERIRELRDEGHRILLSTHVLPDAEFLCDELLLLEAGTVAYSGPIDALVDPAAGKMLADVVGDVGALQSALAREGIDARLVPPDRDAAAARVHRLEIASRGDEDLRRFWRSTVANGIEVRRLGRGSVSLESAVVGLIDGSRTNGASGASRGGVASGLDIAARLGDAAGPAGSSASSKGIASASSAEESAFIDAEPARAPSARHIVLAIARREITIASRRKLLRLLFLGSVVPPLIFVVVLLVQQLAQATTGMRLDWDPLIHFLRFQSLPVVLLALGIGAPLVATDRSEDVLFLYATRPVQPLDYALGKHLAVALPTAALLFLPGALIAALRLGVTADIGGGEAALLLLRLAAVAIITAWALSGITVGASAATRRARWALMLALSCFVIPDAIANALTNGNGPPVGPGSAISTLLEAAFERSDQGVVATAALFFYGALGLTATTLRVKREMTP